MLVFWMFGGRGMPKPVFLRPNVRAKATAEADAAWPRKDDMHCTWSGQAVAAVAGRRLSEGLAVTSAPFTPRTLLLPRSEIVLGVWLAVGTIARHFNVLPLPRIRISVGLSPGINR